MNKISATPFETSSTNDGKVEIEDVHYDLNNLEITIGIFKNKGTKKIIFDDVCGFRAFDEGDLSFWWEDLNLSKGWCFEVSEGGWFEFEKQRKDFFSGSADFYREFLVIGVDLCVSVITKGSPTIHEL